MVRVANEHLEASLPEYIERYGRVGSEAWWRHYDAGRIARTSHVGTISYVGPSSDGFGEVTNVVRINSEHQELEYEYSDYWINPVVALGNRVHIDSVSVEVETSTGPVTTVMDVRVAVEAADTGPSEQ